MIITGCQRSGTMTCAQIFGIHHEVQFTPNTTWKDIPEICATIRSEASWLAAPFLESINKYTKIVHLVRNPLDVIGSLIGIDFWENESHNLFKLFINKHLPAIHTELDSIQLSILYWLEWNAMCDGYSRIRIEDIHNAPKLNKRNRSEIRLEDLPAGELKEALIEKASEYGYSLI